MLARTLRAFPRVSVAVLLLGSPLSGQNPSPSGTDPLPAGRRQMTAERLRDGESVRLDGRLDEPVWQRAVPASEFIQQAPVLGGPPTEATEVRIVFDREHLYIGVTAHDSEPDKLLGNTMKRDAFLSADDRFMWTMDTFLDQQTGYFFEMNPSGLMADALILAGGGNERGWDGIWDARARHTATGWMLEIKIPFRTLSFDPEAPAWGINFQRTVRRKNEESLWTGHERNQGLRRMSSAGLLLGIRDVSQGRGLDIKPYLAATTFEAPGSTPPGPRASEQQVGLDLFYSLTPSLRANLTLNTDFAQTQVDQRLVNLTRFPVRFPEKRDFFLDGAAYFSFTTMEPFFSRRIGLDTRGQAQGVDVGSKLTGRAGAHDVGFLHVRTGEEAGSILGEDFTVLRLKRRMQTQSYVGTMLTRRAARTDAASDALYTVGVDFRLATSQFRGRQNLSLDGFLLWNTNPLDTGDNMAYGLELDYPNDRWVAGLGAIEVQPNFNPAIGFTPRRGYRGYTPKLTFGPRPANHPWVRQLTFGISADLRTDMDNDFLTRTAELTLLGVETQSGDNIQLRLLPSYERLQQDFRIHPGVVLPGGQDYTFTRYRLQANTANRRVLSTNSSVEVGNFYSGTRQSLTLGVGVRPRRGVAVNLTSEWNRVDLPEGKFDTRLYRLLADTQFSPWFYLVNNLQYDSVSGSLGGQFWLRWIVSPGNDLYLVYTHNWVEGGPADRFETQDRRAAGKFVYTYRW